MILNKEKPFFYKKKKVMILVLERDFLKDEFNS